MTKIVDINDCREQGYDWAAAVSGSKNYMAAHIITKIQRLCTLIASLMD